MDTYSISMVARDLGVGRATVRRAQQRLGLPTGAVDPDGLALLQIDLGTVFLIPGVSRESMLILAALALHPLGLRSVRAVARSAGVSSTTATRCLPILSALGLVERREEMVAEGRAVSVHMWFANVASAQWLRVDRAVRHTILPAARPGRAVVEIPQRMRHLFWNAPARLRIGGNEAYIAGRVLTASDPQGVAWASERLPRSAWLFAAGARGLSPRQRALAENLAQAAVV